MNERCRPSRFRRHPWLYFVAYLAVFSPFIAALLAQLARNHGWV
jgi:hypothetical protein